MTSKGPKLFPTKRTVARRVFLEPELWEGLSEAARFHSDVFTYLDADEQVSRNDLIDTFLRWALQEYWEEKNGKPASKQDWNEKAKKHADVLRAEQSSSKK